MGFEFTVPKWHKNTKQSYCHKNYRSVNKIDVTMEENIKHSQLCLRDSNNERNNLP